MENKDNKRSELYKKMIAMSIGPVLLLGIVITWFCYARFVSTMFDEARLNMKKTADIVAMMYDLKWGGDYYLVDTGAGTHDLYKGETNISVNYSIVDEMSKRTDSEISLLYMDMRIHTTLRDREGARLVGVCTHSETSSTVLAGKDAFYKDILIEGENYLVLYTPIRNLDGSITGMVEVATKSNIMKKNVWLAVWPALIISILGMLLAAFVSYRSTNEIVGVIKKLQKFMGSVANGDLMSEIDTSVFKRKDELGDMARASTAMQKSIRGFIETDPLTKLGNRRYVKNMTDKIQQRALENGQNFSVAIGDIDYFKKVNDTYGHNAGDEVLKAVADTLKRMMQGKGFAARWGGEEFIMVFDKYAMYDAADHLWKILENIREMVVETEGYVIKVTMTFGVVTGSDASIEAMVEAADAKLYYGKQNGRNRVVTTIEVQEPEEMAEEGTECEQEEQQIQSEAEVIVENPVGDD